MRFIATSLVFIFALAWGHDRQTQGEMLQSLELCLIFHKFILVSTDLGRLTFTLEAVDNWPTIYRLLIKPWWNADQVSIVMSIEYLSRCWSRVSIEGMDQQSIPDAVRYAWSRESTCPWQLGGIYFEPCMCGWPNSHLQNVDNYYRLYTILK